MNKIIIYTNETCPYKKTNFSEERRIIEQLKTLTYNIQTAFGRTSQILTQIETKIK